jgi:hypothetical protein
MEMTKCPICNTEQEIIAFDRDDPVLLCGHTLTIELQEKRDEFVNACMNALRDVTYSYMRKHKLSYVEANRKLTYDLFHPPSFMTRLMDWFKSLQIAPSPSYIERD